MDSWRTVRWQVPPARGSKASRAEQYHVGETLFGAPVIIPGGREELLYDVFEYPGIISALVKVARGALELTEFCDLWGTLRDDPVKLDRMMSHACSIERALSLPHLDASDETSVDLLIAAFPGRASTRGDAAPHYLHFATAEPFALYTVPQAALSGRQGVEDLITKSFAENLSSITFSARVEESQLKLTMECGRPIVAVYWMAAMALSAQLVRTCKYCTAPFVVQEPRQRYCPPISSEAISAGQSSACSSRRWKQRHRSNRTPERGASARDRSALPRNDQGSRGHR